MCGVLDIPRHVMDTATESTATVDTKQVQVLAEFQAPQSAKRVPMSCAF